MQNEAGAGIDMDRIVAQLIEDFRAVVAEGEALLQATMAGQDTEGWSAIRTRLGETLSTARDRLGDVEALVAARARAATRAVDEYVHAEPWTSVLIAGGLGILAGLLLRNRDPRP